MDVTSSHELEPGARVGDYIIEEKIGSGGFGTVYGARHAVIGKAVAVKVLKAEVSSHANIVERFLAEARAVNRIRHRNIIDIFDFGELADGRRYYVMERLEGVSLDQYMAEKGVFSPREVVEVLEGVAQGLDAAHAAGIIHRDVKPQNIVVEFDADGRPFVKLLDFGVAKLVRGESVTETIEGMFVGTPAYMSPEQCRGAPLDARADLYSLGVVAYEMLTGIRPFVADSSMGMMIAHLTEPPCVPSQARPGLPPHVDDAILAVLAKRPEDRPASALEGILALVGESRVRKGTTPPAKWTERRVLPHATTVSGARPRTPKRRRPFAPVPVVSLGALLCGIVAVAVWQQRARSELEPVTPVVPDAAAAAAAEAPACDVPPETWCSHEVVIDDMEDGDGEVCNVAGRKGMWTVYGDGTGTLTPPSGDLVHSAVLPACRGRSARALHLQGRGVSDWGAGIAGHLGPRGATFDLSRYHGIRFWARADTQTRLTITATSEPSLDEMFGGTCRPTGGRECTDNHSTVRNVGPAWTQYNVRFAELKQNGHGVVTEFDVRRVNEIHFGIRRSPADDGPADFDLWIDDIVLY